MKINKVKFGIRRLKIFFYGMVLIFLIGHPLSVIAADSHEHHHHHAATADPDAIARTLAAYKIPEVKLVESNGQEVLLSRAIKTDRPVMINFIFTTCTAICPVMSASFSKVAQQLDAKHKSVQLISISIDPEQDTPAKLKEYAEHFDAGSQWRLFTGTVANSIKAQRAFDAYRGDKMNHVPLTLMRGANSTQWVRIEGLASADQLLQEFSALPTK